MKTVAFVLSLLVSSVALASSSAVDARQKLNDLFFNSQADSFRMVSSRTVATHADLMCEVIVKNDQDKTTVTVSEGVGAPLEAQVGMMVKDFSFEWSKRAAQISYFDGSIGKLVNLNVTYMPIVPNVNFYDVRVTYYSRLSKLAQTASCLVRSYSDPY